MIAKRTLFLLIMLLCFGLSFSANASLFICEKGRCDYTMQGITIKPWLRKLYAFFKAPNARIDFCEANPKNHSCLEKGLNWQARSPVADVYFSIPVARTLPHKTTLLLDYMVSANAFLPQCGFSISTFEEAGDNTIRLVSNAFECQLMDFGRIKLQNTIFIDYIDFDNSVIGGQYTIQTHGQIQGLASGYTMMKFRDGNTLLPLVPQPYYGEMPKAPTAEEARQIAKQMAEAQMPPTEESGMDRFINGVKDWWEQLKESFNLDKPKKPASPYDEPTWWDKFSDNFMKVFYLEPLD